MDTIKKVKQDEPIIIKEFNNIEELDANDIITVNEPNGEVTNIRITPKEGYGCGGCYFNKYADCGLNTLEQLPNVEIYNVCSFIPSIMIKVDTN